MRLPHWVIPLLIAALVLVACQPKPTPDTGFSLPACAWKVEAQISGASDGTVIYCGIISEQNLKRLQPFLHSNSGPLRITSAGGDGLSARFLAMTLSAQKMSVVVSSLCASACADLAMHAPQLRVEEPVALIYHAGISARALYGRQAVHNAKLQGRIFQNIDTRALQTLETGQELLEGPLRFSSPETRSALVHAQIGLDGFRCFGAILNDKLRFNDNQARRIQETEHFGWVVTSDLLADIRQRLDLAPALIQSSPKQDAFVRYAAHRLNPSIWIPPGASLDPYIVDGQNRLNSAHLCKKPDPVSREPD